MDVMKELKEWNDIIMRKAHKSNIFVILNKNYYIDKINDILKDEIKFQKS